VKNNRDSALTEKGIAWVVKNIWFLNNVRPD